MVLAVAQGVGLGRSKSINPAARRSPTNRVYLLLFTEVAIISEERARLSQGPCSMRLSAGSQELPRPWELLQEVRHPPHKLRRPTV